MASTAAATSQTLAASADAANSNPSSPPRFMSVDALRGFDMFWIIGADAIVEALAHMNKSRPVEFVANQLEHAEWAGFHFEDLIFPLFVFIMGVSTVFSLGKIIAREGKAMAVRRIIRRSVLLFAVALVYSGGVAKPWPDIRLMGVLNRIALCYFFGGILFCFCKPRVMAGIAVALLLGYWALLACVPFPDVRPVPGGDSVITAENFPTSATLNLASTNLIHGTYIQGVNLTDYLDQKYLAGKKYDGSYDPEGYLSTLPAVVSCLLGIFAGLLLKNGQVSEMKKVGWLLLFGVIGVAVGTLWGTQFPIIKKIWTSSFVVLAAGYSAILLGVFYFIVDVMKFQAWCQPFVWMGMNSITIYLTSNFIGGFNKLGQRLAGGDVKWFFDHHVTPGFGQFVISIVGLCLAFAFVGFLHRKKVFLRL